nr:MAG TPA: hypothetical protein [Caudoviricetes sp.]
MILVHTNCLPSPCRRRYRPRTTMETPLPCRIFSVIFLAFHGLKFITFRYYT